MHRSPSVEISPPIPQTDDRRPATSDSPVVIALGDSLAIGDVRARHSDWKAHLANARAIEIDGAALGKVDTAALQLLVALVQDARGRGVPVKWRGVSNALREGAARLGVTPFLQLS
jgi:ABC-type transporter Mla MlaB component